jgi:hypothetical protein
MKRWIAFCFAAALLCAQTVGEAEWKAFLAWQGLESRIEYGR